MIIMDDMEEINEALKSAEKIIVYKDGIKATYLSGSDVFNEILKEYFIMTEGSREMPAYGVSLNNETVKALKSGLWVEFVFDKVREHNEMPYQKLLIGVEKDFCGFNIIRYTPDYGYDGRCFYLDLDNKNMAEFYDFLLKL